MTGRLAPSLLAGLPADIARPPYDREAVATGIVHLGIGAFHRAHQAIYTEDAIAAGDRRWGILGASLRSAETRDALAPQSGLYTLAVRDGEGERLRVVGSVRELLVAPETPGMLLDRLSRPEVAIASLTVTEKGYCHDPATGTLDETHPDIVHDLAHPLAPRSAIGFLVRAIERRRAAGLKPFTVMSCDNLPGNGRTTARLLARFAERVSPDLAAYVAGEIACPDTMVDRIVPSTTEADRRRIGDRLGVEDAWPVMTEPFSQWVIEDHFPAGRPEWERAGATLSSDVAAYEAMKLRLLNGSHSAIAYLGCLAGWSTVAEAMADEGIALFITRLMDDTEVTLKIPAGADVGQYRASLIARFRNPALQHRTAQIAMDGSQKLPQRILNAIRDRLRMGAPVDAHALVVAAWMLFVARAGEAGTATTLSDPMAPLLLRTVERTGPEPVALAEGLLSLTAIFGTDLSADPRLKSAVVAALRALDSHGASKTAAVCATQRG